MKVFLKIISLFYLLSAVFMITAFSQNQIFNTFQARGGLLDKLRRRGTSNMLRRNTDRHINGSGVPYNLPEGSGPRDTLYFRSDFEANPYLPGLPYWRFDNAMPGVTRADRFRGNYRGYQSDYYYGRRY